MRDGRSQTQAARLFAGRRNQRRPLFLFAPLLLLSTVPLLEAGYAAVSRGEAEDEPKRPFLIGYMESESPSALKRDWFRGLAAYLNTHASCAKLRSEMEREGYGAVSLSAAEGFADLVNQMENRELDCVFCPAVGFVRQIPPGKDVFETRYTVVFQIRRPGDIGNPPLRKGAIVVNRRHPLFRPPSERSQLTSLTLIARHVARDPIAFVSRYSAPGYIYPLNMLSESEAFARPIRRVFRGSSEEVVKLLLSDVVAIGACELSAIDAVLAESDLATSKAQLLDILRDDIPGSPSDPILFRRRHNPGPEERSKLGKELLDALGDFFAVNHPGRVRLEASDNLDFRPLKQAVEMFDQKIVGRGGRP